MRVSTQQQAQDGDSLAAQREALTSYIRSHSDMVMVGEYMDDGVSGQKYAERDELQRMLSDVEAGRIDLIICTKMDRLHRSLKNFLEMQAVLDRYNVQWLAIWEPMYDTTTPAGQLIINQMMSFAQFEAQNTGSRIRAVAQYKLSQGQVASGAVPCGYSIADKRLVPNEIAPLVREAFEFYSISGNLNATLDHCAAFQGLPRYKASFRRMLTNRTYIGEHRGNMSFCQPIINRSLFDDVQRKLSMNIKSSQKHCHLFTGLMVCTVCGGKYTTVRTIRHKKGGDEAQVYYRCYHHYNRPKTCDNKAVIREQLIEDFLIAHLKDEIKGYVFECQQKSAPIRDNSKKVAELQRKIERLKELYINDLISMDEYKIDKAKYLNEIEELSRAIPEAPVDTSELEALLSKDIGEYYQTLSREERRFFWRSIIRELRMDSQKQLTIVFA